MRRRRRCSGGAAVQLVHATLGEGLHQGRAAAAARLFAGGDHRGGKTVWLAGQTATVDDSGRSLAGDFEGQARQIFKLLGATLEKAGGKLGDMVQMTVFITDVRYGDRLTQIRREMRRSLWDIILIRCNIPCIRSCKNSQPLIKSSSPPIFILILELFSILQMIRVCNHLD